MLDKLKNAKSRKGVFVYTILGAICLVFVFMGMDMNTNPVGGNAAVVNNTTISIYEYRNALNNLTRFYSRFMGNNFDTKLLGNQALDSVIRDELLSQESKELGIYVTPAEVGDYIVNIPAFQEEGRFRKDFYFNFLESRRLTAGQFEKDLSRGLTVQKTRSTVEAILAPSSLETAKDKNLGLVKRSLKIVELKPSEIEKSLKIDKAAIQSFLNSNSEKVKADYDKNISDFKVEEKVKARHILVKSEKGAESQALAKANEIRTGLNLENFSAVAGKKSEDPGSAAKGGDLGFFKKGMMVKEFEQAAFSQKVGEISQPIKSNFGYHIILVDEKKAESTRPFDTVKDSIAEEMLRDEKIASFDEDIKTKLKDKRALNKKLKSLGLKWQDVKDLRANTDTVAGLGNLPAVVDKVFAMDSKGLHPDLINAGGRKFIIELSSMGKDKPSDEAAPAIGQGRAYASDVVEDWLKKAEETASITKNTRVIQ
ncbi:MAG: SurA N-terminal domain-containing protein [Bdellovibrionales bacterium]